MGVCPNPKKLRSTPLTPIHDYLIAFAQRLHTGESPTLLDYGCGAGEIVQLASSAGMDAYGVEMFYGGGSARDAVARAGLLGTRVLELEDGVIPFPDSRFDVIVSNQVFEHIDDFEPPVREIHRVMKSGGVFINIFPSVEVWREGHIGIPFVHWFEPGLSRVCGGAGCIPLASDVLGWDFTNTRPRPGNGRTTISAGSIVGRSTNLWQKCTHTSSIILKLKNTRPTICDFDFRIIVV